MRLHILCAALLLAACGSKISAENFERKLSREAPKPQAR